MTQAKLYSEALQKLADVLGFPEVYCADAEIIKILKEVYNQGRVKGGK